MPLSAVEIEPGMQPMLPPESVNRLTPSIVKSAKGIGQSGCSMPSGGRWSLLTG